MTDQLKDMASNSNVAPLRSSERPLLSVCIPAHNEEKNIDRTMDIIAQVLRERDIPFEFVIANDNSSDGTERMVRARMDQGMPVCLINRTKPGGFGRAIRSCLNNFSGEFVVIVMADCSDDPHDIVRYYDLLAQGYDAVFGSRFLPGSVVKDYPRVKLIANRIGNFMIRMMFRTHHNDLTNAFKGFRANAIRSLMPLYASHFNITIEISIGLLIRNFKIATTPINWYGRTWGQAKFRIRELGRRYFATMIKLYAEWFFIRDDLMVEHKVFYDRLSSESDGETVVRGGGYGENSHYGWRGVRRL
jgi:dolichol-phosphate mannosyltransferase